MPRAGQPLDLDEILARAEQHGRICRERKVTPDDLGEDVAADVRALVARVQDLEARCAVTEGAYETLSEEAWDAKQRNAELEAERPTKEYVNGVERDAQAGWQRVAELTAALEEIAGTATDLPSARRRDRDEMREIARAALAKETP